MCQVSDLTMFAPGLKVYKVVRVVGNRYLSLWDPRARSKVTGFTGMMTGNPHYERRGDTVEYAVGAYAKAPAPPGLMAYFSEETARAALPWEGKFAVLQCTVMGNLTFAREQGRPCLVADVLHVTRRL